MLRRCEAGLLCLLLASCSLAANAAVGFTLAKGARVGIVNLLDPEVTHYHGSKAIQDSFMKTQPVGWRIDQMLADALRDRLSDLALVEVPVAATEAMKHLRDSCFVESSPARGLSRECLAPFGHLAAAQQLDAIIVLGPGINDSAHGRRRKDIPEYLRGWGFVSGQGAGPTGIPSLFNMTELLLLSISGEVASQRGREWGGSYELPWSDFQPPADPRVLPGNVLDQLQPLFADILARQCARLLEKVEVER